MGRLTKTQTAIGLLCFFLLIQSDHAYVDINTTLEATSSIAITPIPAVDNDLTIFFFVLMTLVELALLVVSVWIIAMIVISGSLKNNIFLYHILNLAVADAINGASMLVIAPEQMLAPYGWGLSSPLFSYYAWIASSAVNLAAMTQHFIAMAVIAGERLYAVVRPLEHQSRGAPIVTNVILSLFFALNLTMTVYGYTVLYDPTALTQSSIFYLVVSLGNQYLPIALVILTLLIYAVLIIFVRRQAKVGAAESGVAETPAMRQSVQITKAVLMIGIVYVATAFTSNVALSVIAVLYDDGQLATGPYDVLATCWYVPLLIGEFLDLLILASKIDDLKTPSIKYFRMLGCRKTGMAKNVSVTTTTRNIKWLQSRQPERLHLRRLIPRSEQVAVNSGS